MTIFPKNSKRQVIFPEFLCSGLAVTKLDCQLIRVYKYLELSNNVLNRFVKSILKVDILNLKLIYFEKATKLIQIIKLSFSKKGTKICAVGLMVLTFNK